jgi:hypothetical protein
MVLSLIEVQVQAPKAQTPTLLLSLMMLLSTVFLVEG